MDHAHAPLDRLGIELGHHTDSEAQTGLTAFVMRQGASIGINVAGGSAGTFNTPIFEPTSSAELAHSVVLTGGSIYGLASVHGVLSWLEEQRIGRIFGGVLVPDVAGAVIFDLLRGRSDVRPTITDGYNAAANASGACVEHGAVGVATGATTGKWYRGSLQPGGFACATVELPHDLIVSAFAVTNAIGDVGGDWVGNLPASEDDVRSLDGLIDASTRAPATTLVVVATNAALDRSQLSRVASTAAHGLARSLHPASVMSDGDTVFALSSMSGERRKVEGSSETTLVDIIGIGAAEATRRAVLSTTVCMERR
jgi:L-aminopeptidase/D-esterase-like protein